MVIEYITREIREHEYTRSPTPLVAAYLGSFGDSEIKFEHNCHVLTVIKKGNTHFYCSCALNKSEEPMETHQKKIEQNTKTTH